MRVLKMAGALVGLLVPVAGTGSAAAEDPVSPPRVAVTYKPLHSLVAGVMKGIAVPDLLVPHPSGQGRKLRPEQGMIIDAARVLFWLGPGPEPAIALVLVRRESPLVTVDLMRAPGLRVLDVRAGHRHIVTGSAAPARARPPSPGTEPAPRGQSVPDAPALPKSSIVFRQRGDKTGSATPERPAAGPSPSDRASKIDAPARRAPGPDAVARPDLRVWLDPRNAIAIVREVAAALSRVDPRNAARYRRNAAVVIVRIETLDAGLGPRLLDLRRARYAAVNSGLQYLEDHYLLAPALELGLPEARLAPAALRQARARLAASGLPCLVATARFVAANGRGIAERTGAQIAVLDTYGEAVPPGPDAYFRVVRGLGDQLMACIGQKAATR